MVCRNAATPPGSIFCFDLSGGIAPLNPRLIAATPFGVKKSATEVATLIRRAPGPTPIRKSGHLNYLWGGVLNDFTHSFSNSRPCTSTRLLARGGICPAPRRPMRCRNDAPLRCARRDQPRFGQVIRVVDRLLVEEPHLVRRRDEFQLHPGVAAAGFHVTHRAVDVQVRGEPGRGGCRSCVLSYGSTRLLCGFRVRRPRHTSPLSACRDVPAREAGCRCGRRGRRGPCSSAVR